MHLPLDIYIRPYTVGGAQKFSKKLIKKCLTLRTKSYTINT